METGLLDSGIGISDILDNNDGGIKSYRITLDRGKFTNINDDTTFDVPCTEWIDVISSNLQK